MLTALFTGILTAVIILLLLRWRRARQKEVLKQFTGPLGELVPGQNQSGVFEGTEYEAFYFPGGPKRQPPLLTVSVACESDGGFKVTRERAFDRFFKRHGITNEVQTLDPKFDDDFFIRSEMPDFAREFFRSPERRLAARAIFELGYNALELDRGVLNVTCSPFRPEKGLPADFLTGAISQLATLAADVPVVHPGVGTPDMGAWKTRRRLVFAVPVLGLVILLPLLIFAFEKYPPLDSGLLFLDSLKYSMPLLLVFAWAAVRLLRGRSSSHYEIVVVWALALVAFPLVGLGLETLTNGRLDNSASSSHTVVVRDKYMSKQKSSTYYRLVLASWRPKERSEILEVSSGEYQRVKPNQTKVRVVTKPGHFGFEWRVSYDILADGPW